MVAKASPLSILKKYSINNGLPWPLLIFFLLLVAFPLLMRLDAEPLHQWDESLFALRALSIAEGNGVLFNFNEFEGGIDHPNGKPIFFTLVQAASFRLLGYNELAMRLPVALISLATIWLIVYFCYREFNNLYVGLLASVVLVCSEGYVFRHVARTGDHDAVLAFLLLVVVISFYWLLNRRQVKYLWVFAIATVAAILTKNIAALMMFPGLAIYAIYSRRLPWLLRQPVTYIAALAVVLAIVGYYVGMNEIFPGHWKHVWEHEMGGRYATAIHGHQGSAIFYLETMVDWAFAPWFFWALAGLGVLFIKKLKPYRNAIVLLLLSVASHLAAISSASTKLFWYNAPVYPLLAIVAGAVIWQVLKSIVDNLEVKQPAKGALLVLAVLVLFAYPYGKVVHASYRTNISLTQEKIGGLLRRIQQNHPDIKRFTITEHVRGFPMVFYQHVFEKHRGYNISWSADMSEHQEGDLVAYCSVGSLALLAEKFETETITQYRECQLVKLKQRKPPIY